MNLFGKKKPSSSSAPSANPMDTIQMLRDNLTVLEKRQEFMGKRVEAALAEAIQKKKRKDQNGAIFALKRKKMYEAEINKLQGTQITLGNQIQALESATVNVQTFKAMKAGADAMRSVRGDLDADKVDDIMDAIQEETDIHDQISEAISRPGQDLFDDEDLLEELAELDELDALATEAPAPIQQTQPIPQSVFNMPTAPTTAVTGQESSAESEDERALRELQASMLA